MGLTGNMLRLGLTSINSFGGELLIAKRKNNFILRLGPLTTGLNIIPLHINLKYIFHFFNFLFDLDHVIIFENYHESYWSNTFRDLKELRGRAHHVQFLFIGGSLNVNVVPIENNGNTKVWS